MFATFVQGLVIIQLIDNTAKIQRNELTIVLVILTLLKVFCSVTIKMLGMRIELLNIAQEKLESQLLFLDFTRMVLQI